MTRKRLPSLPETGRHYVEDTLRARLASPGLERYPRRHGGAARAVLAVLLAAALVGVMLLVG